MIPAAAEYRRALELCPQFVDIRLKFGDALRDAGKLSESILEYEQIIEQNEAFLPARVHYGIALFSAGRKEEAARVWQDIGVAAFIDGGYVAAAYLESAGFVGGS